MFSDLKTSDVIIPQVIDQILYVLYNIMTKPLSGITADNSTALYFIPDGGKRRIIISGENSIINTEA